MAFSRRNKSDASTIEFQAYTFLFIVCIVFFIGLSMHLSSSFSTNFFLAAAEVTRYNLISRALIEIGLPSAGIMNNEAKKPKVSKKTATVLWFMKLFGLTPIASDTRRVRSSKFLIAYNVVLAIFFAWNTYYSERDSKNDKEYNNIALLIGIVYDSIDVFGNLYISWSLVWSTWNVRTSSSLLSRLKKVDGKLSNFDVHFDYDKLMNFTCLKIFLFVLFAVTFAVNEILLCARLDIFYTFALWITALCPLYFATFVSVIFGSVSLAIFQRYWVVNRFLQELGSNLQKGVPRNISRYNCWDKASIAPFGILKDKAPFYIMLKKGHSFGKEENVVKTIKTLRDIHFDLFRLMNDFNSAFGYHFFFQFAFYFSGCTVNLYFVIIFHLRQYDVEQYISSALWTITLFFLAIHAVFHTNLIINEAQKSTELVHTFLVKGNLPDPQIQIELNVFSTQLVQCPVHIKAAGFFDVGSPMLFQFLTGVLSSVIFIVQFDKVNFAR